MWQTYFTARLQKLWYVLVCLDGVFCANVLAARLDPSASEGIVSPSLPFSQLKEKIYNIAQKLEPWITKTYEYREEHMRPSEWLGKAMKHLKKN